MEGSNAGQEGERRSPDQDAAAEAALLAGTLPEEDRRANGGAEGPEDEAELVARDAEDLALVEARRAAQAASGEANTSWEEAKEFLRDVDAAQAAARATHTGIYVPVETLAAVHQFLATLSGPEATRAAALRAQLPAVPS